MVAAARRGESVERRSAETRSVAGLMAPQGTC